MPYSKKSSWEDYDYNLDIVDPSASWYEATHKKEVESKKVEAPTYEALDSIAEKALEELERNGIIEVLILRDDQVAAWWAQRKKLRDDERRERERIEYEQQVRETALGKLTSEERRILGLPTVVKRVRKKVPEL